MGLQESERERGPFILSFSGSMYLRTERQTELASEGTAPAAADEEEEEEEKKKKKRIEEARPLARSLM